MSFLEGVSVHQLGNGFPILSPTVSTITNKHLLQLKLTLKQRLKSNKCGGKTRDCRMLQLLVFGVPPHETKNKTMVVNSLGMALA